VASYGARAWGKYNIDKKGKKKSSNGTSAADDEKEGKEATRKDDGDTDKKRKADRLSVDAEGKEATIKPGTGKNAKKNLKKRQKRNELEKAKAAGML
jgi:protein KRI1